MRSVGCSFGGSVVEGGYGNVESAGLGPRGCYWLEVGVGSVAVAV